MNYIDCFLPSMNISELQHCATQLKQTGVAGQILQFAASASDATATEAKILPVPDGAWRSSEAMRCMVAAAQTPYLLLCIKAEPFTLGEGSLQRMLQVATDTHAALLYADYTQVCNGERTLHPTIDYQLGSLRDDFDFGGLVLIDTQQAQQAIEKSTDAYHYAGWYDLRLRLAQQSGGIVRLNEPLYTQDETDTRLSGQKQFDYVNPANRAVQIEMEQACTEHLKRIGAYMAPHFEPVDFSGGDFANEASVIIPVRNRERTIEDAIQSALTQQTNFPFNVIIIDNHSTDATGAIVQRYAQTDSRVLHLVPSRNDLGIGGCWMQGINHTACGRFAVQLDSDDVYQTPHTLQAIVDGFHAQHCGMLIGAYTLTDINKNTLAPGLIDHREWTSDNGRNNALRLNGLGAPRAFYTPLLRQNPMPNTSYGEDYAIGLRLSRTYQIGRIFDSLYLCRRWNDNSDAALDTAKINANNLYKDKLRTIEIAARMRINS